jgi:hypothetical protein
MGTRAGACDDGGWLVAQQEAIQRVDESSWCRRCRNAPAAAAAATSPPLTQEPQKGLGPGSGRSAATTHIRID